MKWLLNNSVEPAIEAGPRPVVPSDGGTRGEADAEAMKFPPPASAWLGREN